MTQMYKVIKLKSGEELIAEVSSTDDSKMVLNRPMVFKTIVMQDQQGYPREGIVLKNWLAFGNETETTIPMDFVATMLEPTNDVVAHYILEKEKQAGRFETKPIDEFASEINQKKPNQDISVEDYENMISDMFQNIFKDLEEEKPVSKKPKQNKQKLPPKDQIIHMSLVFPPHVLAHMINQGLIDPRDIMDMIDHFGLNNTKKKRKKKNRESINDQKFTGEQKERPDYGNKWTDWNPDPSSDEYQ